MKRAPADVQGGAVGAQGRRPARRHDVQPAGRARGLHRLRHLRRRLPVAQQDGWSSTRPSTWRPSSSTSRPSGANYEFFLEPARGAPLVRHDRRAARLAAAQAAVRVLRRLLRLRRDAVHQADLAALRRPHGGRQRDRLLVDLRRQPAHHALLAERGGPGPGLGEQPVRGQRRVRPRHAPCDRRAERPREDPGARAARRDRRGAGRRAARREAGQRRGDRGAARAREGS